MKAWELKRWDKWDTWIDGVYTFIKMDWAYAQWEDKEWNIKIGHNDNYLFNSQTLMYE